MRTQNLQMNLTQKQLDPILFRTEETGREIEFTLIDPDGTAYDLTDYALKFTMLKPDGNVIYQDLSGGILTQTEQMTTSRGIGYYAIRVSDQDTLIYTGQGKVVIDDHVISDEALDSISEVDGLIFPDDFLTINDHVAVIDDDVTSTDKTWSSSKINYEIDNASVEVSKTADGNPIEISDAASAPIVKCITEIQGSQDLHGYDKPWVGGSGKNKFNKDATYTGSTVIIEDDSLKFTVLGQGQTVHYNEEPLYIADKTITISATTNGSMPRIYFKLRKLDDSGWMTNEDTSISGLTYNAFYGGWFSEVNFPVTYAIPNCLYANFGIGCNSSTNVGLGEIYIFSNVQLEIGSTASPYSPYSNICPITAYTEGEIEVSDGDGNTTHTTTYPSAIYRGSEDVVKGTETHDRVKVAFDGSNDEDWRANNSYPTQFAVSVNDYNIKLVNSAYAEFAISNMYDKHDVSASQRENGHMTIYNGTWSGTNGIWLAVRDDRFTTLADFKAAIATTPIELAYKMETPTTSSVTPTNLPIKSLSGYTHIESSTGNIEVEYITPDYQPLVDSIEKESVSRTTKLWDAGFTPAPGVWLEYDFGEDLENYDAIVIEFVVSGWEGNNSDSVTVYPKMQHLNTNHYYHYIKGTDYGIQFWHVSGTTYGLGSIDGNYPPQYKAVYGIKY